MRVQEKTHITDSGVIDCMMGSESEVWGGDGRESGVVWSG